MTKKYPKHARYGISDVRITIKIVNSYQARRLIINTKETAFVYDKLVIFSFEDFTAIDKRSY